MFMSAFHVAAFKSRVISALVDRNSRVDSTAMQKISPPQAVHGVDAICIRRLKRMFHIRHITRYNYYCDFPCPFSQETREDNS
jgi:hypothetical protein